MEFLSAAHSGNHSRRRDCHFADVLSPSMLNHLLKGEGERQQNDSLTLLTPSPRRY